MNAQRGRHTDRLYVYWARKKWMVAIIARVRYYVYDD